MLQLLLQLDIRKKLFIVRVVRHWTRLPSQVVGAPYLEAFKARLGGVVSNLVYDSMIEIKF